MKRVSYFVIGLILFVLVGGCATTNSQQMKKNDTDNHEIAQSARCMVVFNDYVDQSDITDFFVGKKSSRRVHTACSMHSKINYAEVFDLTDLDTKQNRTLIFFSDHLYQLDNTSPTNTHRFLNDLSICQTLINGRPKMCADAILYLPHK